MELTRQEFKERQQQQLVKEGSIAEALQYVKYKIAILSGKGGVGKTATTVNLAAALQNAGQRVGVFDADLHGPSVPKMLGIRKEAKLNGAFWLDPVVTDHGIKALSVALFWPGDMTPVMWRGQAKSRTIRQLLSAAKWGGLDYLLVDLPPGTGDEPIAILKSIPDLDGVIIVTTPQEVSTVVCSKAVNASMTLGANVLGLVENMSAYVCRDCGDTVYLFGKDKGRQLARMMEIPFLGSIPIDPLFSEAADAGIPVVNMHPDSLTATAFVQIAETLANQLPAKDVPEAPIEESKPCPGSGQQHHHGHDHDHGCGDGCNHPHHSHHDNH
ncbi:Cytosolic Fe-S cluster assembling factor NBP35 [Olavius algarvensis associated proteobacterium Delta 3]|nr:Cytosolic Fe-S cluster assembling factor NBP35 [Olavius algarvensis associated proteobacterium Delta 3]